MDSMSTFCSAAASGDASTIRAFLDKRNDINDVKLVDANSGSSVSGMTALHHAVCSENMEAIELLIDSGIDSIVSY